MKVQLIERAWRGEISLPYTFWLLWVGTDLLAFTVLDLAVEHAIIPEEIVDIALVGTMDVSSAITLFATCYSTFVLVCLWRSIKSYVSDLGNNRTPKIVWAYLARLFFFAGVFRAFLFAAISVMLFLP